MAKNKFAEVQDKLKCPNCGGGYVRHQKRNDTLWCRKCGHVWPCPHSKKKGAK